MEAVSEAKRLSQAVGWDISAGFTGPKLLWLKEREPESWERLAHVLLPHDYVNFWLTGVMAMEVRCSCWSAPCPRTACPSRNP